MERRSFLKFSASLLGSSLLYGCDQGGSANQDTAQILTLPEFSAERLHAQLDTLSEAYEDKGLQVSKNLLPALDEQALAQKSIWFPGEMIAELIALYGWREGQEKDAWETEHSFLFRDNAFTSMARAEKEYESIMESYGAEPEDHDLLESSFPFAAFNGGWFVLPTGSHPYEDKFERPVISVHEGIDVYFYSIESMVKTCIDWVRHPAYANNSSLPRDIELAIWEKHNPGIFSI